MRLGEGRSNTNRLAAGLPIGLAALAVTVAVVIPAASADPPQGSQARAPRPAALTSLDSCDGLRAYYAKHRRALRSYSFVGMPAEGGIATDDVPMTPGDTTAPTPAPSSPTTSPTNVQEAGVDEPDIVKTAGSTIFTVDGDTLRAVDASGDTPVLSGTLKLPQGPGENATASDYQLLLAGDRLLAIGSSYSYAVPFPVDDVAGTDIAYASPSEMIVAEIDISDPAAMHVLRSMSVEGSYVSARLTGSTVRLVTSDYPSVGALDAESGHGRALVPKMTIRDRTTGKRRRAKLVKCDAVSHPARFAGAEMLSVLTIDMQRGLPAVDVDSVLSDGQIVYASPTALYVATERWLDPDADASELPSSDVNTEIHRFDISDPDSTAYVASGKVTGYMLSQWSMSEQDGLLRVASTTSPPFTEDGQSGESESFVTVLAADGDQLREVGKVGGLGRGEQIYAVRFIGDAGYVVTFRQVDPLYTLDLSDPTAPRVVGELKIPGYSAYLHPVGPGLLLGIGQDASAAGQTSGLQASLFDVSDPANPVRIDRESFGAGSSSEVEYDHHAFSFFDADALAMLPLDSYSYSYGTPGEFHGAVGLRIDPAGADPLGRVAKISSGSSYESQVRRSLELGGRVYTIASNGIAGYDPATLAPLGSLPY